MKLKNKKGFTLIELLAVIVVLAIIALIATPIVMNTIKNAKKGAAERTADNYIKQVETTIAEKKLENNPLADGPYTIDGNGNLTGNGLTESVTIDMNGTKPSEGTVTISNGGVSQLETTMTVGDYDVKYNQEKNKYEASEKRIIVYRNTNDTIKIGDIIDPNDTSKFTKEPTKWYHLKHVLDKNNKVLESYACIKENGKEYCLTNDEYGWSENEEDYTGNVLKLKKMKDEKIEGVTCSIKESSSYCGGMTAYPSGKIELDGNFDGSCYVYEDGSSSCGGSQWSPWH